MDEPKHFDRVVVAVGPDDLARQALAMGAAVAAPDDLPIDVVSVVAPGSDELPERRSVLAEALAASEGIDESSLEILTGWSVAQELAEYADAHQPALLCMATAVRSRTDDALLGSNFSRTVFAASRLPPDISAKTSWKRVSCFSSPFASSFRYSRSA